MKSRFVAALAATLLMAAPQFAYAQFFGARIGIVVGD